MNSLLSGRAVSWGRKPLRLLSPVRLSVCRSVCLLDGPSVPPEDVRMSTATQWKVRIRTITGNLAGGVRIVITPFSVFLRQNFCSHSPSAATFWAVTLSTGSFFRVLRFVTGASRRQGAECMCVTVEAAQTASWTGCTASNDEAHPSQNIIRQTLMTSSRGRLGYYYGLLSFNVFIGT